MHINLYALSHVYAVFNTRFRGRVYFFGSFLSRSRLNICSFNKFRQYKKDRFAKI